jgi:pantoate--beta-alanine ligase
VLSRALARAQQLYGQGETSANRLLDDMRQVLAQEPLAMVEYVSVADPETLDEQQQAHVGSLVSMAVRIGRTRLIDNVVLGTTPNLADIVGNEGGGTR